MAKKFGDDGYSDLFAGQSNGGGYGGSFKRCYHSHPALKMPVEGKTYEIYGGNCHDPIVVDADIYVGLDGYANRPKGAKGQWPWEPGYREVQLIDFPITDMAAPKSAKDFKGLIDYLCNQLQAGKKIHVGCIGGHGRTGTVLAAVVQQMMGEKDAINYVRKHYCHKAVESQSQINFLGDNYGITAVEGSKSGAWGGSSKPLSGGQAALWGGSSKVNGYQGSSGSSSKKSVAFAGKRQINPVQSPKNIW
jgi:hypothetical protein